MKIYKQIDDLEIPYPQKFRLKAEVEHDLAGVEDDAFFSNEDLSDLEQIHNTHLYKFLERLDPARRRNVEAAVAILPLLISIIYFAKERFMFEFIREGGFGMVAILFVGVPLLLNELVRFAKLILVKDHKSGNLRLDSMSVILGCLILVCLGAGGTGLGLYKTAVASLAAQASLPLFVEGLKESLANTILGSTLAAAVLLIHFTSRRLMIAWRAPIQD